MPSSRRVVVGDGKTITLPASRWHNRVSIAASSLRRAHLSESNRSSPVPHCCLVNDHVFVGHLRRSATGSCRSRGGIASLPAPARCGSCFGVRNAPSSPSRSRRRRDSGSAAQDRVHRESKQRRGPLDRHPSQMYATVFDVFRTRTMSMQFFQRDNLNPPVRIECPEADDLDSRGHGGFELALRALAA